MNARALALTPQTETLEQVSMTAETPLLDVPASHDSSSAPAVVAPVAPTEPAAIIVSPASAQGEWPVRAWMGQLIPPLLGLGIFLIIWTMVSQHNPQIPTPLKTWRAAVELFSDPFYKKGPNDQGIGLNILASLGRVGIGFGLAALVGIPLGFLLGRFTFLNRMGSLIISILRPVSPLAWLPIGLLLFQKAEPAAIWVIFISSIWPMILNTATGVERVPQDYLNVARVLNLSEWKVFTRILFPAVLPYTMTGIRLSISVAWLVIVAAEMLTGGVGLGFWVWDEWNNLNVEHIIVAIFVVGLVGLLLEQMLLLLGRRFQYE